MAHQLKLTIYQLSIRQKGDRDSYMTFEEFLRLNFCKDDESPALMAEKTLYKRFVKHFAKSFGKGFVLNYDATKGIAVNQIIPSFNTNVIDGMIKGGVTGIENDLFDISDSSIVKGKVKKNQVSTLQYYFKFWFPNDSQTGILMIQSYTHSGVNNLIFDQLKEVIQEKNSILTKVKFVPKGYKERFKKRSKVYRVTYFKNKFSRSSAKHLNQIFDQEDLNVKLTISGLNLSPEKFLRLFKKKKLINSDLSALEMVDDNDFETIAEYVDEFGHRSQARISNKFDILPTYFLPEALKSKNKDVPDYNKIRSHTNTILTKIKEEINYSPKSDESDQ